MLFLFARLIQFNACITSAASLGITLSVSIRSDGSSPTRQGLWLWPVKISKGDIADHSDVTQTKTARAEARAVVWQTDDYFAIVRLFRTDLTPSTSPASLAARSTCA